MRKLLFFGLLIFGLLAFASCEKEPVEEPQETKDLAAEVAGTYIGNITHEGQIYFADYTVTVTKINDSRIRCQGEDDRLPTHEFEIREADQISGVDWIVQTNTAQLDSVFTFVRDDRHLTIIRKDLAASFDGSKE